jgi:DNA-binding IclR family transcriptional regulator
MDGQEGQKGAKEPSAPRIREVPDPRFSRSLEYGAALLECFTSGATAAGVVDFAAALGTGRSTAHRYAATLHALGYLEQDKHRKYRLGRLALEPGMVAIATVRASMPAAAEVLAELRDRSGHTAGMGVLDGARAIYVHRLPAHKAGQHEADLGLGVGASLPLHCTSLGKALLASLEEDERSQLIGELALTRRGPRAVRSRRRLTAEVRTTAERGLALSDEELAPGVRSIAVAVPNGGQRRLPIAIDLTAPASAYTAERLVKKLGPLLIDAARRIGEASAPTR